jgi:hypothetical protein
MVFSHTALTASGRPFRPSQTSMHTLATSPGTVRKPPSRNPGIPGHA